MSNLIEREKAIRAVAADLMANAILKSADASDNIRDWIPMAEDILSIVPTVDAVPVVHGEWVDDGDPLTLVCGVCDYRVMRYNNTKFCPDCGVLMDGKDGEQE